ncbi:sensor histidine kinase [Paenibacillus hamazuiensis]|uniref:sensor histidine kinase n=1 Tax=Paenibacillus hamazuiensis TaxID=2936508 RepID=UPI002010A1F8
MGSWLRTAVQPIRARFHTIRYKMFVIFLLITVPSIATIGVVSYSYSYESQKDRVEGVGKMSVSQIQRNLDFHLEQVKNKLLSPYYNSEFIDTINRYDELGDVQRLQFHQSMRDFFSKNFYVPPQRDLAGFYIFLGSGELIYQTAGLDPDLLKESYRSEDWVRRTVDRRGTVYFSGAYPDHIRGERRFLYGASIMVRDLSSNRNMYSIIRSEYKFDSIEEMSRLSGLGSSSKVLLLDGDSRVLYSTGEETPGTPWRLSAAPVLTEAQSFWLESGAQKWLVSGIRSGVADWSILILTPEKEVFDAAIKIRQSTWIVALTALIVTAAMSALFSSYLTKPILTLYRAVSAVKQGNLSIRAQVNRDDETGKIAVNFNSMVDEIQNLINTKYVYQLKLREAELAMLYSQINPHFLYNTLDSIRSMADYYDAEEIVQMTTSLADMFRYSTTSSEMVTVEQELRHIRDYLTIQLLRFGSKIQVKMDVAEPLMTRRIPKMTLQPLVENAIYHGLEKKKGPGLLTIRGWEEGESIGFAVEDDGEGIEPSRLERIRAALRAIEQGPAAIHDNRSMGIGLINVHARLAIKFGAGYEMRVSSAPRQGTSVTIRLPKGDAGPGDGR